MKRPRTDRPGVRGVSSDEARARQAERVRGWPATPLDPDVRERRYLELLLKGLRREVRA